MSSNGKTLSLETVAKVLNGLLLTICLGLAGWAVGRIVDHGDRIARLEVTATKRDEEVRQLNARFDRLMDRLDRLVDQLAKVPR
jgi:hypothetical protein